MASLLVRVTPRHLEASTFFDIFSPTALSVAELGRARTMAKEAHPAVRRLARIQQGLRSNE